MLLSGLLDMDINRFPKLGHHRFKDDGILNPEYLGAQFPNAFVG